MVFGLSDRFDDPIGERRVLWIHSLDRLANSLRNACEVFSEEPLRMIGKLGNGEWMVVS